MKRKTKNNYFRKVSIVFGFSVLISILLVTGFYFRQKSSPSVLGESAPPTADSGISDFAGTSGDRQTSNLQEQAFDVTYTGSNISQWPYKSIITWTRKPDYKGRYAGWYKIQLQDVNTKQVVHDAWYYANNICSGTTCSFTRYISNGRYDVAVRSFYENAPEYPKGYYFGFWAVWNPEDIYSRDLVLARGVPSVNFNLRYNNDGSSKVIVHIDKHTDTSWYQVWDSIKQISFWVGPDDCNNPPTCSNGWDFEISSVPYNYELNVWIQGWGPRGFSQSTQAGWFNKKVTIPEPIITIDTPVLSGLNLNIVWSHPLNLTIGTDSAAEWYQVFVTNAESGNSNDIVYNKWLKANDGSERPNCDLYGNCYVQVPVPQSAKYNVWIRPYYFLEGSTLNQGYYGKWVGPKSN